jgi:hypothetical protein
MLSKITYGHWLEQEIEKERRLSMQKHTWKFEPYLSYFTCRIVENENLLKHFISKNFMLS